MTGGQEPFAVRFEWGPVGAAAVAAGASVVAVVDVLSFTTTLSVAVERGMAVMPYRWRDASAAATARRHDAVLAVGRSQAGPDEISLSPVTVRRAEGVRRLVLPSPNGATVAAALAGSGAAVVGVSLRNAGAAASWARRWLVARPGPVAVVAAGERWGDGSLRPAVEDLWGAGAFIHALVTGDEPREAAGDGPGAAVEGCAVEGGWAAAARGGYSSEAGTAVCAYLGISDRVTTALRECASGAELIGAGFAADVDIAAESGSPAVPLLTDGWFRDAHGHPCA
ncbi:2-phosphosulfolactate phosphatase [Actinoplanes sp. NPDC051633]|uniref:2-phosphosulfolactate phosphatase n=1 Tax=Actinoplanes sp. NPDC051633 TaxID=3155670 RepID=UPI00341A6507